MAKDNDNEILKRIDQFHQFYSGAWNKLTNLIAIGFIIVGVIVPALSVFLQWRSFKTEADDIRRELSVEQSQQLADLRTATAKKVGNMGRKLMQEIHTSIAEVHDQSSREYAMNGDYVTAVREAVKAASEYTYAENDSAVRKQLVRIADDFLPKVNVDELVTRTDVRLHLQSLLLWFQHGPLANKYAPEVKSVNAALETIWGPGPRDWSELEEQLGLQPGWFEEELEKCKYIGP